MGNHRLDIGRFRDWALGNLVGNTNRGIFAEWLVGQALGAIDENEPRDEWDECDLVYQGIKVEVKASGRGQAWKQDRPSDPEFDIEPKKSTWNAETGKELKHDPPERVADVYVFCLHEPMPATNENVRDLRRGGSGWCRSRPSTMSSDLRSREVRGAARSRRSDGALTAVPERRGAGR